ncbi:hypothetical protein [Roseateles sp.]|jgi:hypothetical protein|uniref:hypothetical protein n=1 Tax=Roseateles sp. TaxID=1971397 RepID=UPI0037CA2F28
MAEMFSAGIFGFIAVGFLFYVWSIGWAYQDAKQRGKPPLAVALMVMFGAWPMGLIIWVALRPGRRRPPFNLEDFRRH